jgi:hypothetical protein
MTRFGRTFLDDYDVGEVLHELSETVVDVLDVDGAGVSIGDADRLVFVTATDERSMQLEWRQSQSQDGPCTDAWRTRRPVLVEDIVVAGLPTRCDRRGHAGCRVAAHDRRPRDHRRG